MYSSMDFEEERVGSVEWESNQRPECRLNSQVLEESDPLSGFVTPDRSSHKSRSLSRNLKVKVETLDTALQDAGKISVTWRRLSIFLMILLVFIVATITITLVVVASRQFETVQNLYIGLNETTAENDKVIKNFVLGILEEKEAAYYEERKKDEERMRSELGTLRDDFARNQSGVENKMRQEIRAKQLLVEQTYASKADVQDGLQPVKKDLQAVKKDLQAVKDELQTAKDELQAVKDELRLLKTERTTTATVSTTKET